jgi:broad specificity phosphatase PhoE
VADIVLVRHAATSWSGRRYCGRSDPPLDRPGRDAAHRLAADVRSTLEPGIAIVASPRRRAVQTASAIAAAVGCDAVELDERWAETDFGIAEGLTFDELAAADRALAARIAGGEVDIDWPGGERAADLTSRVEAAWRDLAGRAGSTLVVSHGGPIRIAISLAAGRPPAEVAIPELGGVWRSDHDPRQRPITRLAAR